MKQSKWWLLSLSLVAVCPATVRAQEFVTQELTTQEKTFAHSKCDKNNPIREAVTVVRGVDGDTVVIKTSDERTFSIRMLGIDTPETHYFGHSQGEWGERASARLKEILPAGTKVNLELSPDVCDSFGRVLAHVYKGRKNVNVQMAKEGLAVNYCIFPAVSHCEEIGAFVTAAQEARIGMFSDSSVEIPYDWRRRVSNRVHKSFIGNTTTKEVYLPESIGAVPVGDRIFFGKKSQVKTPYHFVQ